LNLTIKLSAFQEVAGRVRCGKVNCDESKNRNLCSRIGIRGYPTIYFYNGASDGKKQNAAGQSLHADGDYIIQFINHSYPRVSLIEYYWISYVQINAI
jgi:hypothetical protein